MACRAAGACRLSAQWGARGSPHITGTPAKDLPGLAGAFSFQATTQLIPTSIRFIGTLPLPRERAVHPTPASITLAPARSTAAPVHTLEQLIGEMVANAAAAVARALRERANGGLTPATKMYGGDLIARLYSLRQACLAELDFDAVAREQGAAVLRQGGGDARTVGVRIDGMIDFRAKVG